MKLWHFGRQLVSSSLNSGASLGPLCKGTILTLNPKPYIGDLTRGPQFRELPSCVGSWVWDLGISSFRADALNPKPCHRKRV